ncbi:MAG: Fic family protein [Saprospiraceae bacterium]|nr:Fic family protein [Saprospiraceae bacterium]
MAKRCRRADGGCIRNQWPGKGKLSSAPASTISNEMQKFMAWYNNDDGQIDLIIKAAIAHLWFVTIHPFGRWQWKGLPGH